MPGKPEVSKSQTNGLLHLFFRRTGSVTKGGMCVVICKKRHALSPSSKAFLNDIYTSVVVKINQHVALGLPFQPSLEISRIEEHDSVDFSLKVPVCMTENNHVAFFLLCLLPDRSNTRYSVEMSVCQEDPMASLPDNELVRQLPGQVIIAVAAHNIAWQVSGCLPKLMCLHLDITCNEDRIDILQLGQKKTALFVTISDMDRSQDMLANLFYTQAMNALCRYADKECEDSCLPVPVRFILDDFATNACIPDFDKMISVIRSRGIAVSIILQSQTQLEKMYKPAAATTILNGCDTTLYLGGHDLATANYIGTQVNRTDHSILTMPREHAWLIQSGQKPRLVKRYDLTSHPRYGLLPEAKKTAAAKKARATTKKTEKEAN